MRVFIAVTLADDARRQAENVSRELERRLDPRIRASWVAGEKMHLTVRFIGPVEDARVPTVLHALEPPLPMAPFDIVLGGCGAFPRSGPPRVLWIAVREGISSLQAMHEELDRRLRAIGFEPEDRAFNAHLTLARIKEVPRDLARTTRETVAAVRVPSIANRIDHATVFQSQLSPKGSTYVSLLCIRCEPTEQLASFMEPTTGN